MSYDRDITDAVEEILDSVDIVSFDLFDTLIVRGYLDPTDIFEAMRQSLNLALDFKELRVGAHRRACAKMQPVINNRESTLAEIYLELERYDLPGLTGYSLSQIMALELALERKCISTNDYMRKLYLSCCERGKKVIITTDTYFDREFLNAILADAEYLSHSDLIISAEGRTSKHEGTIWESICATQSISAKRILHIGDNWNSDVVKARRFGIRCIHYPSALDVATKNTSFRRISDLFSRNDLKNIAVSEWLASIANRFFSDRSKKFEEGYYWFGYAYVGVLLLLFTHWLHKSAKQDGVEKLLFLARDGYLLKQLYETVYSSTADAIPATYIFASRRSFLVPSINQLDEASLFALAHSDQPQTVGFFLERMGLTVSEVLIELKKAGFENADVLVTADNKPNLYKLFISLHQQIDVRINKERCALQSYFSQMGVLEEKNVGLVDVGWHGSLQKSYEYLVNQIWHIDQRVIGYYLGLREPSMVFRKVGSLSRMSGFLCHLGYPSENLDLIHQGATILEFVLYAPHGTTLYFENRGEGAEPVLDSVQIDFNIRSSSLMQAGVSDAVRLLAKSSTFVNMNSTSVFLRPLRRFVNTPTLQESRLYGKFQLSGEFGRYVDLQPMASPKLMGGPLELLRGYHSSTWKSGYLKQIPMATLIRNVVVNNYSVAQLVVLARRVYRKLANVLENFRAK